MNTVGKEYLIAMATEIVAGMAANPSNYQTQEQWFVEQAMANALAGLEHTLTSNGYQIVDTNDLP